MSTVNDKPEKKNDSSAWSLCSMCGRFSVRNRDGSGLSLLRIQTHEGEDLVTISLDTGHVEVTDSENLDDSALAFWDAVTNIRLKYPATQDVILRAPPPSPKPGDIIIRPGKGTEEGRGGNVEIYGAVEKGEEGHERDQTETQAEKNR